MKNLYNVNGLPFWEEKDLRLKRQTEDYLKEEVKNILLSENQA